MRQLIREVLFKLRGMYKEACKLEKTKILNEIETLSMCHRKDLVGIISGNGEEGEKAERNFHKFMAKDPGDSKGRL